MVTVTGQGVGLFICKKTGHAGHKNSLGLGSAGISGLYPAQVSSLWQVSEGSFRFNSLLREKPERKTEP